MKRALLLLIVLGGLLESTLPQDDREYAGSVKDILNFLSAGIAMCTLIMTEALIL